MDSEKKFRIAFLGSDEIALPFLLNLERSVPQCEISAVLTQPDRPSGRGRMLTPNPIKQWAMIIPLITGPISPGMEEITLLESLRIDYAGNNTSIFYDNHSWRLLNGSFQSACIDSSHYEVTPIDGIGNGRKQTGVSHG